MKVMVHRTTSKFIVLLLFLILGLHSQCRQGTPEKNEIRSEYLKRHAYQQELLGNAKAELRIFNDKLHSLIGRTSAPLPTDSVNLLFIRHFRMLMTCEKLVNELQELNSQDSLLFEMYGDF